MFHSSLILASILPLMLCGEVKAADELARPISYAAYHSEWGEKLTPPWARSIHLELKKGSMNVSLSGNMPHLYYSGPVDDRTFNEIAKLLCSMDAAAWTGSTGDEDKGQRRKDRCEWSVCIAVQEPNFQQSKVYGSDKGKDTPRLAAEAKLCDYLRKKLPELYASEPKQLAQLYLSDKPKGGYWSVHSRDGRISVCVITREQPNTEFYADPKLLDDLLSLLKKSGAEAWHGFGHGRYEPGKMPICLELSFNTRQPLLVQAEPESMPKGFAEFCTALTSQLNALALRWQKSGDLPSGGIKRMQFGENGMRMQPHYEFYRRLDDEGARAHIMRVWNDKVYSDKALSPAEEEELAKILRGLSAWDGFDGNARDVLDAPGFSLSVEFADGKQINARGYGKSPQGYREGRDQILDFFEKRLPK